MPKLHILNTITPILNNVFGISLGDTVRSVATFMLCKGIMPASPEAQALIPAGDKLSGNIAMGATAFITPTGKTTSLASSIAIPIVASVTSQTPTFIRIFGSATESYPIMDIPVSLTQEVGKAQISSMSVSTGDAVQLLKLNLSLANGSDMLLSDVMYNVMLNSITLKTSVHGYVNSLRFGKADVYNNSAGTFAPHPLTIEAYSDIALNNIDDVPTELIWSKTITAAEGVYLTVSGNNVFSNKTITANAVANGQATYIRLIKEAVTAGTANYPKMVLQLKVGVNCFFSSPNMTLGQPSTLEQFNVVLL